MTCCPKEKGHDLNATYSFDLLEQNEVVLAVNPCYW